MWPVRYVLTWILTAPLLVVGLLAGHSLGYRLAVADARERAHVLDASGHGYLAYAPLAIALGLSLALLAFVARVRAVVRGQRSAASAPPWVFALLPPLAFIVQEYGERALHQGALAWGTVLEPAVLSGLALQVPFALIALAVARALARLAEVVGRALGTQPRTRITSLLLSQPFALELPPSVRVAARGWSERGPPLSSS
jgi:hypothetical protein